MALAAALGAALLFAPAPAAAAVYSCSVSSSGIVFSSYDTQTRAAVDGTGTITVTCTGDGSNNSLSLNLTGGNNGSCGPRQMRSGASNLSYDVFQNAARTAYWCEGGARVDLNIDFTSGSSQTRTFTMFARVTAAQNPGFGSYSDNLTVVLKRGGGTVATGTVSVAAPVSPTCSVSAGSLGFGAYSGAAALSAASVSVNCSSGGTYQVSLGAGAHASGGTRRMAGPAGAFLAYQLFRDSARTLAWGDGSALGARVSGTGSGAAQTLTVFGRIPAGQSAAAGSYTDSVVVTVEY
ncbi:MAG TPA: spore coat U domain-containing protein [Allosphingosinicella sp.]